MKKYLSTKFGINSFTAAGDFSRQENHIDARNSAVKELICLMGSEKTGFMDDGRATDTGMMTVALLCSSTKLGKFFFFEIQKLSRRID